MTHLLQKLSVIGVYGVLAASLGIALYKAKPEPAPKLIGTTKNVLEISKGVTIPGENITLLPIVICDEEKFKESRDPYLMELNSFKDERGASFFDCEDAFFLQMREVNLAYIRQLTALKDRSGHPLFTAKDMINFKDAGGTVEYARQFAGSSFSGKQLPQLYRLGLSLEELIHFKDTTKPNALLIYPTEDQRTTFRIDDSVNLFKQIGKGYDTRVAVASTENEVYAALDASRGFKLAMISGHGTETTLALGKFLEKNGRLEEKDEAYFLDISDHEFAEHLSSLHPKAVIFLNSCANAKKTEQGSNLADKVADWSQGRTVIAATEDFYANRITINSLHPFDVTLLDWDKKKDLTRRYFVHSPE